MERLYFHIYEDATLYFGLQSGMGYAGDLTALGKEISKLPQGSLIEFSYDLIAPEAQAGFQAIMERAYSSGFQVEKVDPHPVVFGYRKSYLRHLFRALDMADADIEGLNVLLRMSEERLTTLAPDSAEFAAEKGRMAENFVLLEEATQAFGVIEGTLSRVAPREEGADLPAFKYHPDPVATGSIQASELVCRCCGRVRGYIYNGPVWGEREFRGQLCPWCIHDGSAAALFQICFVEGYANEGGEDESNEDEPVSDEAADELYDRTPGFYAWQNTDWYIHCGDFAEFLGPGGKAEIEKHDPAMLDELREEMEMNSEDWEDLADAMGPEGDATAYIFRCRHCGKIGGYLQLS